MELGSDKEEKKKKTNNLYLQTDIPEHQVGKVPFTVYHYIYKSQIVKQRTFRSCTITNTQLDPLQGGEKSTCNPYWSTQFRPTWCQWVFPSTPAVSLAVWKHCLIGCDLGDCQTPRLLKLANGPKILAVTLRFKGQTGSPR